MVLNNSIMVIHPYKQNGVWIFDDEDRGLLAEPFVAGAEEIIERLTADILNAESGFTLLFSASPFPGARHEFERRREEGGGNWYYCEELDREGWLCPALYLYFETAPEHIYAEFREKRA